MSKLRRTLLKNRDLWELALGGAPRFVRAERVHRLEEPPVFTFHEVTASGLEPQLRFLAENGYRTLTADELYDRHRWGDPSTDREVVLTFDDGHESLWSVAYPLLRTYGLRAVAFVVPGLIADGGKRRWGPATERLCSWPQLREMHASGVVDAQSHSLYHHTTFVSPRIIDFVRPDHAFSFLDAFLFPVGEDASEVRFPDALPPGTPVYESDSRFSGRARYFDDVTLRGACAEFVDHHGGADFFQRPQWRLELQAHVRQLAPRPVPEAVYETGPEREVAIRTDLRASKALLEHHLPGARVRHFAFPWYVGTALAARLSAAEGYVSNFWGREVPSNAAVSHDPVPVRRLNPEYLWRLPGNGRQSLARVLLRRAAQISFR